MKTTMGLPVSLRDEIKAAADAEHRSMWEMVELAWREHKHQEFLRSVATITFDDDYLEETASWQDADLTGAGL